VQGEGCGRGGRRYSTFGMVCYDRGRVVGLP
jgi:hypothetical protein